MNNPYTRLVVAGVLSAVAITGCGGATGAVRAPAAGGGKPLAAAAAAKGPNEADVYFMTGMIPHHAQAVVMAGWAPTHGARADVAILCERIVVGQRDEILLMQNWLSDHGAPVPDAKSTRMKMVMGGMEHEMLMSGMLTDEEMTQLDHARGADFDRLFLIGMIKHHQGAVDMVDDLFKAFGAAQDETVFKFASDVYADQSTEIDRMEKMLSAVKTSGAL
jgi:uncharacterized protein (DUF305 family)